MANKQWGLSGPAFKKATSTNSLAVINKPVRMVVFEAAYHTLHLNDHNRIGLGSRGPVSTCKDATLKSKLYMMSNSSITGCDPLKKYTIN